MDYGEHSTRSICLIPEPPVTMENAALGALFSRGPLDVAAAWSAGVAAVRELRRCSGGNGWGGRRRNCRGNSGCGNLFVAQLRSTHVAAHTVRNVVFATFGTHVAPLRRVALHRAWCFVAYLGLIQCRTRTASALACKHWTPEGSRGSGTTVGDLQNECYVQSGATTKIKIKT